MVNPRCRDAVPLSAIISSVQSKEAPDPHVMELGVSQTCYRSSSSVVFARYSDFRYLVVWV